MDAAAAAQLDMVQRFGEVAGVLPNANPGGRRSNINANQVNALRAFFNFKEALHWTRKTKHSFISALRTHKYLQSLSREQIGRVLNLSYENSIAENFMKPLFF